jgi:phosphoribosylamine--glycine ligase
VLTDGNSYKILPEAKDYKRVGEGDTGLNTGGMGAVSPVPFADSAFMKKVEKQIVIPTIEGLKKEQITYKGFIFIGLMATPVAGGSHDPYVIEYNVRMGDPETEVVVPRIQNDLVELFELVAAGLLEEVEIRTDPRTAVTVMLVSGGYPGDYEKGKPVSGLDQAGASLLFHSGTASENEKIHSAGGRVLAVTSFGESITKASKKSYETIQKISFEGMYYRKDIGKDLVATEKQPHE